MNNLKIHDIKPLVEVSDYSLYLFISLLIIGIIVFSYLLYFLYQKFTNKKQNRQKFHIQELKTMNYTQSKTAAYNITHHISKLLKDEPQAKLANELLEDLKQYKYKKEVASFNNNSIILYKKFLETL